MKSRALLYFLFYSCSLLGWQVCLGAGELFEEQIVPILEQRCLSCHNDQDKKGDFSLQNAASAFSAGYIEPGKADESYFLDLITPENGKAEMPKASDPLSDQQIELIRRWVNEGAKWPKQHQLSEPEVADLDWWSLKPLKRPVPPEMKSKVVKSFPVRTPVDAFILKKQEEQKMTPAVEADRRTLIRRLYFDLLGLPPTPEEITSFVEDSNPDAYEQLVDRLLDSKHYGERWARHWLDVVHYADTHGYDKDKLRPNAWPYRDYVIRSFNEDKPYSRFVREQIAGDALWPHTRDGIIATGFISAGPWDFIGHAEVPETKIDGKIARHLDRDDMVSSTFNTFCSTTVQCAQCHNHKFDPVTQENYYSLQAVFSALDRADKLFDADPETAEKRTKLLARQDELKSEREQIDSVVKAQVKDELAALDQQIEDLKQKKNANEKPKPEFGYHSQIAPRSETLKWVQIDLGEKTRFSSVRFAGCHDDFNGIGHGFGFPVRYKIEASDDERFEAGVVLLADFTQEDVENPGTKPITVPAQGLSARYLRFTATKLAERKDDFIFALAELMVFNSEGKNLARNKSVTALDSIEAPVRWQKKNLVDGYYYALTENSEQEQQLAGLNKSRALLLEENTTSDQVDRLEDIKENLGQVDQELAGLPAQQRVYCGTVHTGKGTFVGTGGQGGKPRTIHVLHRGNILDPREEVRPGAIPVIPGVDWQFSLPKTHGESERRVALANWLVHHDNPLTWRSIVNRVWQYHFGRGLVDTPNDFGRMGQLPTHPELLDWLAVEFRDGGQSMKKLHKLLVMSSVYRQASTHHPGNSEKDSSNQYLWRMNRRRLTAEEVRDAVLSVSGKLDEKMYGPGFQLFEIEHPEHSPHYEYDQHNPDDPRSHRRTVYRFIVRSQPDPFMTTLDCADSSQSVAKRDETMTALQALSLLNNKFMLRMSEHFAQRVQVSRSTEEERVDLAFALVTGRYPTDEQRAVLLKYSQEQGTANLCRLLFNLNEFVFVD